MRKLEWIRDGTDQDKWRNKPVFARAGLKVSFPFARTTSDREPCISTSACSTSTSQHGVWG